MTMQDTAPRAGATITQNFNDVSAIFGGTVENPHEIYRKMRASEPVMKGDIVADFGAVSFAGSAAGRQIYTVFKHGDVLNALRDVKTYTSSILMENGLGSFLDGLMITGLDGEPHRRLRGLLQPSFTASVMDEWRETMIRPLLKNEFVEALAPHGKAELVREMGVMFPIRVVYAVLGFPDDPAAVEEFAATGLKILAGPSPDPAAKQAAFQAFKDLYNPTRAAVDARRAQGPTGGDLISRLMRAEFEGHSLDDHQITNFVRMMLPAAAETTTRTFTTLMTLLLERPALLDRIREDRSLIKKALEESMRYDPVATFKVREVQEPVTLQGVEIPKGSILSLCVASANRDESVFDNPDEFDVDRKQLPSFGFGFGPHMCVGLWLAKAEIEVAIDVMLDLMPNLRFDPAYPKPEIKGVQMRGPEALHVIWDKA
jgi:cytochrome P450